MATEPSQLEELAELRDRVMRDALGFERLEDEYSNAMPFLAPPESYPPQSYDQVSGISFAIGLDENSSNSLKLLCFISSKQSQVASLLARIDAIAKDDWVIVEAGRSRRQAGWQSEPLRPFRVGSSVGHCKGLTGAVTFFARTAGGSDPVFVGSGHVLARPEGHKSGDAIIQPGRADRGIDDRDRVGTLLRTTKVRFGARRRNLADAASAAFLGDDADTKVRDVSNEIFSDDGKSVGRLKHAAATALPGDSVFKVGRSGLTRGIVRAVQHNKLELALKRKGSSAARFDDQLVIEGVGDGAFSKEGDSGALVINESLEPVAQIVGGSDKGARNGRGLTYASPVQHVLQVLGLEILPCL